MAKKLYDIFAAGNALMEATVEIDEHSLTGIDVCKGGMQLVSSGTMHELMRRWRPALKSFVPAGAECNVATGVASLGGTAVFAGRVGGDEAADAYQAGLSSLGVDACLVRGRESTGQILSFITPDRERSMLTHLGEAAHLQASELDTARIEASKCVTISAFFFQPDSTRKAACRVAETARKCNVPVAFDVSDAGLVRNNAAIVKNVIEEYADIVFLNQGEMSALDEICDGNAGGFLRKNVDTYAVKRGKDGALIVAAGITSSVPAVPVEVVDTTGAGDAFAAGFLLGLLRGLSPVQAGVLGCKLASKVVVQYGSCLTSRVSDIDWGDGAHA